MPINISCLAHYLSKALILPSKYLPTKPQDIQNKLEHSILLSKKQWVKNSDCSIEIVLTTDELNLLANIDDNFLQLNIPLPISRIRNVYFLDEKQMQTTIWNINNGAAFIPIHLVSIVSKSNIEFVDDNFISNEKLTNHSDEIEKKINRFDTALGGMAFMKVGGKNFGTITSEFSENYFITLSFFNKIIEEQTNNAEKEKDLNFSRKYLGLFSLNSVEWSKWRPHIYKNIELQDVEEIAEKEGLKIEKKYGLLNIDSINEESHLYDIAILATYGERKNKSIDDLVNSLQSGNIAESKKEDIAILFGLNTGYSKLRNKYKANSKEFSVKFKLDSKLDYYTVESIYQFSFHNNRSNGRFEFIDELNFPKIENTKIKGFETYSILDKTIIAKKKQTPLELFLEKYSNGIYEKLSHAAKQLIPTYADFDSEKAIKYFRELLKDNIVSALQQYEKTVTVEFEETFREKNQMYEDKILLLQNEINDLKNIVAVEIKPKEQIEENELSVVSEPVISTQKDEDYEKMSLPDLRKIAKEKGIKVGGKAIKKDIIDLIKNTNPLLL